MTDSGDERYDYSALDDVRRSFGFCLTAEQRADLQAISRRVAEAHNITNREAHSDFVFELWRIMDTQSRTYIEKGEIKIAADTETLKTATEDIFPELNRCLSRAVDILHDAEGNETFLAILLEAAEDDGNPGDQIWSLFGLADTVAKAAEFSGKPGRRRRPDWVENFCRACQRFWHSHGTGGTKINFKAPRPPAIARWLEQLFAELRDFRIEIAPSFTGYRPSSTSAMKKVAQSLTAFRPPREDEKGV